MAVKKKASKRAKKTSSKKSAETLTSKVARTSKKMVDRVLVQISPQLQSKIDHLIETLETSKQTRVGDISLMASKILLRAQEISRHLRSEPKKTSKKS